MIIYTCPECGHDLMSVTCACIPPIHEYHCYNCGWSHSNREEVVKIPFSNNNLKIRDATQEEMQYVVEIGKH